MTMRAPTASGLDHIVAAETALSDVDGQVGRLVIRGHRVEDLVAEARRTQEDAELRPSPNMRDARVLVLDDDEKRHDWFRDKAEALNWELLQAWTAEEAIESLDRNDFDLVFLDHDLEIGRLKLGAPYNWGPNGTVAARHIAGMVAKPRRVHIHSVNRGGAAEMERILRAAAVNVTRAEFGSFEISNHAERAAITPSWVAETDGASPRPAGK